MKRSANDALSQFGLTISMCITEQNSLGYNLCNCSNDYDGYNGGAESVPIAVIQVFHGPNSSTHSFCSCVDGYCVLDKGLWVCMWLVTRDKLEAGMNQQPQMLGPTRF